MGDLKYVLIYEEAESWQLFSSSVFPNGKIKFEIFRLMSQMMLNFCAFFKLLYILCWET